MGYAHVIAKKSIPIADEFETEEFHGLRRAEFVHAVVADLHYSAVLVASQEIGCGFGEVHDEPIETGLEMRTGFDRRKEFDLFGGRASIPFFVRLYFHVRCHAATTGS